MSYQVLARKWRPAKFTEVVGQSHVLSALTNALKDERLHHAYLFSGTRGVGKTTLARLFAKGLNCETGITDNPCGQCGACVEISQGRFLDLIEVDAASRTKVDDTREILDNVQYAPSRGRFKVYLIDEVHMLSKSSFNALLKTLEEPPAHVKFLLATTDPQKLPITVLSRCLQFNLKSLTEPQIQQQLVDVLSAENIPFESGSLQLIARAGKGSMRDALSVTEQAISFGNGTVKLEQVQQMLGILNDDYIFSLLSAAIEQDVAQLMDNITEVLASGAQPEQILQNLLSRLHEINLTQFLPKASELSSHPEGVKALAKALSPQEVQLYYKMLLEGQKELPYAPSAEQGLEMALLRIAVFTPMNADSSTPVPSQQPQASKRSPLAAIKQQLAGSGEAAKATTPKAQATTPKAQAAVQPIQTTQATDKVELAPTAASAKPEAPSTAAASEVNAETAPPLVLEQPEPTIAPEPQAQLQPETSPSPVTSAEPVEQSQPLEQPTAEAKPAYLSAIEAIAALQGKSDHAVKKSEPQPALAPAKEVTTAKHVEEKPSAQSPAAKNVSPNQMPETEDGKPKLWQAGMDNRALDLRWYQAVKALSIGARVKQLAVNSVLEIKDNAPTLLLGPLHKHLNDEKSIAKLEDELDNLLGERLTISVEIGENEQRETPLQIRKRFHGELRQETQTQFEQTDTVQWLKQQLGATVDPQSVVYPKHRLDER